MLWWLRLVFITSLKKLAVTSTFGNSNVQKKEPLLRPSWSRVNSNLSQVDSSFCSNFMGRLDMAAPKISSLTFSEWIDPSLVESTQTLCARKCLTGFYCAGRPVTWSSWLELFRSETQFLFSLYGSTRTVLGSTQALCQNKNVCQNWLFLY